MSEITEFLMYTCNINRVTSTWEDEYWTPTKTKSTVNRICYIDSPKKTWTYNENSVKVDAILFLEDALDIKIWDEVKDFYKNDALVDDKTYKVIWVEPLLDDDGLNHVEANLQILW